MSGRIFREPAAQDAFFLKEHFVNAPKARKSETAYYGRQGSVLDEKRHSTESQSCYKPDPPALLSKIVFHFYDSRMTDADAEKDGRAYDDSTEIHNNALQWQRSAMAVDYFRLKR
jgi:hypothetical protein